MVIPQNILYALSSLEKNGFEAYLVGGCVRDMMMNKTPSDFDITTNALPEEIINCFPDKKCVLSGMKHGTVAPIINHEAVEITTYRIDGEYKDSRHPEEVYFTKKIEEDLSRRDFTVNAMAMGKGFNVTDPFFGKKDIENKIIRCVGEAEKRFSEDALRIMRALRFSSTLSFNIEKETKKGILKLYHLLSNIAKERIFTELKKLIMGKNAGEILCEYKEVFLYIMPHLSKIPEEKYYENAKKIASCDMAVAFAILFDGLSEKEAGETLSALKTDRALKNKVLRLFEDRNADIYDEIKLSLYLKNREIQDAERLICYLFSLKAITDCEKKCLFLLLENVKNNCVRIKDLDINGGDLEKEGLFGSEIGKILNELLDAVITKKCKNEKEELLELTKELFNRYY